MADTTFITNESNKKLKTGANLLDASLVTEVELSRSIILNQLSHTAPINLVRSEVEKAHLAISTLRDTLQPVKKKDLQ